MRNRDIAAQVARQMRTTDTTAAATLAAMRNRPKRTAEEWAKILDARKDGAR